MLRIENVPEAPKVVGPTFRSDPPEMGDLVMVDGVGIAIFVAPYVAISVTLVALLKDGGISYINPTHQYVLLSSVRDSLG